MWPFRGESLDFVADFILTRGQRVFVELQADHEFEKQYSLLARLCDWPEAQIS